MTIDKDTTPSRSGLNRQRVVENFSVVWVDANVHSLSQDSEYTLGNLRSVVNHVELFHDPQEFIHYLDQVETEKVFVITSGSFGQQLVPRIHGIKSVAAIFIFCRDSAYHEQWTKAWSKVYSVHTEIKFICEELQVVSKQIDRDITSISFVQSDDDVHKPIELNRLPPSFMYTQILKNILLDMEHEDEEEREALMKICRKEYKGNTQQLAMIEEFSRSYQPKSAVWWYTRECFSYKMLNRSLRLLESDIIVDMGFFIADLHRQLDELHKKQISRYGGKSFVVFRGQGLVLEDFQKMRQSQGGLMAFNNFLSTSKVKTQSLEFAELATKNPDAVGVLFVMMIDPKLNSTPFADISDVSYFHNEAEVLFSMHSVFRIGEIRSMDNRDRLFEIKLIQTGDNDSQLRHLTAQIEEEVGNDAGWARIARLMIKLRQWDKAEQVSRMLLDRAPDECSKGICYHLLGWINAEQGKYPEALKYYQRNFEIYRKWLPIDDPLVAESNSNIGMLYSQMGDYAKALSSYYRARDVWQKTLPPNHPNLATSNNNIASAYFHIGEYEKALSHYNKALAIWQSTLPPNHPDLGTLYNNIGLVYNQMEEYSRALLNYDKALDIRQNALPSNHPDLAQSYNNIGLAYNNMEDCTKALFNYDKALNIQQKVLPPNHPDLALSYNNIGLAYCMINDHAKALFNHNKALDIRLKILPPNHPDLAQSYNNIGAVHFNMDEYAKALTLFEKAKDIWMYALPPTHPNLATVRELIDETKKALQNMSSV